ncbi:AP-3 complex subunit beta-2 [Acromyrmex echinatior]|uniref:AP-3 complex subunit beta n=1 Tax=Acromyrmex echinatior TaxID=103372 RepID=F4WJF0_ACREC|nr:AP-3 complex subunit beta-2 [Acromyrmex echinatior]
MLTAAASMSNNGGSYSVERPSTPDADLFDTMEIPSFMSGLFHPEYKKHDDLKEMLDSNKDGLKLEAMKRIIGMVAKGKDASEMFPAVVKNVVSKNIEVKKLVYVYLVRYAEDQQDLALLSISTFQRALKDPNQLIRASALRVLSSIRVSMIVPIVMLAIKDSASDMSPYVRKTAAHAIPKLYSLDHEQKEELIGVLEKLLSDKTTLVVGSAVMAFEEVCPERIDLIHKNYRKLCNLLVDVDEWGQVNLEEDENRPFYDSDSDDSSNTKKPKFTLDPDHRLLLRNTKPLLQSRNASVVMAGGQLYHHAAPRSEVMTAAKALIRLLRGHREVQSIVLHCIASISITRKGMFEPFLKSFFVRTSDPTHIKLLKLDILTNLVTETSISVILREFQTYISSSDKEFVGASIQAIGRCASNIKEVTDMCLNGLVSLLSNRDEAIVAESVVVIKKLLQTQPNEHKDIIAHMAKLMDFITVPQARASILWLLGEYSDRVPKIAPDVLRKMAKSFVNEQDIVKLQTLNLAVKLCLNNPSQTKPFCQYVFQLAKYDQNYDIRDRARFLRHFIFEEEGDVKKLPQFAKRVFLAPKPAPTLTSRFKNSEYQLGTLSHYLDMPCVGYRPLPPFPEVTQDPSVRDVAPPTAQELKEERHNRKEKEKKKNKEKEKPFYSDEESTPAEESDNQSSNSSSSESSDEDSDSSEYTSESDKSETDSGKKNETKSDDSESESSSDEESDSEDLEEESETQENEKEKPKAIKQEVKEKPKSNFDLLLDLDDVVPMTPVMTPSLGGFLTPINSTITDGIREVSTSYVPLKKTTLLNSIIGHGLKIEYRFTRSQHLVSSNLVSIELTFFNESNDVIKEIQIGNKNLQKGMFIHDFTQISSLDVNATLASTLGVNFNDSTQPANFNIDFTINDEKYSCPVSIKPPIGEIIRSVTLPESMFNAEKAKLKGMNEHIAKIPYSRNKNALPQKVFETANVARVSNEDEVIRFAAHTLASKSLVLVTIKFIDAGQLEVCVNCEKMVIGSILLNEFKSNLK